MRPERHEMALTSVVRDLVATRDGATYFAKKISGVWQRYDLRGDHPLIGKSAPDFEFADGSRLGEYCHDGRALALRLAATTSNSAISAQSGATGSKSSRFASKKASDLTALFVRPDGCVAWASNGDPDLDDAAAALSEWLGLSTEVTINSA